LQKWKNAPRKHHEQP